MIARLDPDGMQTMCGRLIWRFKLIGEGVATAAVAKASAIRVKTFIAKMRVIKLCGLVNSRR